MDINHNQVVYIPKGEHDDPHELPQQQELEGSTEIEHTLYSHTNTIETNSFQKLDYIYCKAQPHHALLGYSFHNTAAHTEAMPTREGI